MVATMSSIASCKSKATEKLEEEVKHFLDYWATHPNPRVRFVASDMILALHSDTSYISEPESKSRAARHYYPSKINNKTSTMEQSWRSQRLLSTRWPQIQRQKFQHYPTIAKQHYRWEYPWRRWDITNPKHPLPQMKKQHRASSPKPWYQNVQNHMIRDSTSWTAQKLKIVWFYLEESKVQQVGISQQAPPS